MASRCTWSIRAGERAAGSRRHPKTDRLDARWLAMLRARDLLSECEAWLPPEQIQRLRDRTRLRKAFAGDRTGSAQRLLVLTRQANKPDEQVIEATLTADGDATILVWEKRGMPLDLVAAYGAGVQVHVEDLAAYLAGRERYDAAFLSDALPLVESERQTVTWFALRASASSFAIVDVFPDEAGRRAHLDGAVASALNENANELLAKPPEIEEVDVLATKLNVTPDRR
jgi:quinol monooxygenase YgiN